MTHIFGSGTFSFKNYSSIPVITEIADQCYLETLCISG
jgi:hypothetical protein